MPLIYLLINRPKTLQQETLAKDRRYYFSKL
jgi:hypothetical protein